MIFSRMHLSLYGIFWLFTFCISEPQVNAMKLGHRRIHTREKPFSCEHFVQLQAKNLSNFSKFIHKIQS